MEPRQASASPARGRVFTAANVISFARLLGVPLFLVLLFGLDAPGAAVAVLAVGGTTDWVDGYVARRLGQVSRLGELLDPFVDRLYILATLLALVARDGLPLWWALLLIGRDAALTPTIPFLRRHGYGPLPVHFLGKAATFCLLYAFPMLLAALPSNSGLLAEVFRPLGWAFAAWGSVLYLWSGVLYVVQVRQLVLAERAEVQADPS